MGRFDQMICGAWCILPSQYIKYQKTFLPLIDLSSSTTILAVTSRTVLSQTFVNPSKTDPLDEVQYTFPLYDGVSVVGFRCTVASRTIVGVVKEKEEARKDYKEAVDRGETAGLVEQLPEASDVFTTRIGNVPPNEKVVVEIVYLGELKHDAETDGSRFTIPTVIAQRYGPLSADSSDAFKNQAQVQGGIKILVDVEVEKGSVIRGLQSPSHPIAVTMGRTSTMDEESFENNHASATLTLGSTTLDKDFVIVVLAKGQDTPRAFLETHSAIPNQRAIMATLVPKFNLPNIHPEIVFIVDRSGSMHGKIETLVSAMKIFLKSLPIGAKFNICSFGSSHTFLFPKSKDYDQSSLQEALEHLTTFDADYGGTEMLNPVKATIDNRFKDLPLEVMVITDGEIWNQQELFSFIGASTSDGSVRFFSLGVGSGASSSLVEGIARLGDGFAQFVGDNEKMDKRVVRMLKGALTPHIKDYTLEVKYEKDESSADDDFEIVEPVLESQRVAVTDLEKSPPPKPKKKIISLFNRSAPEEPTNPAAGRYDHLPAITVPKLLQAPHKIPTLYPFNRTTAYILLSEEACKNTPISVVLRGTSPQGPLELEIPIQDVGHGQTIHQLAAKKAVQELEQGRGWMETSRDEKNELLLVKYESRWEKIIEREAVRLGVRFQVGGKWCSFVAVEKSSESSTMTGGKSEFWEMKETGEVASPAPGYQYAMSASLGAGSKTFLGGAYSSLVSTPVQRRSAPSPGGLFGGAPRAKAPSGGVQASAPTPFSVPSRDRKGEVPATMNVSLFNAQQTLSAERGGQTLARLGARGERVDVGTLDEQESSSDLSFSGSQSKSKKAFSMSIRSRGPAPLQASPPAPSESGATKSFSFKKASYSRGSPPIPPGPQLDGVGRGLQSTTFSFGASQPPTSAHPSYDSTIEAEYGSVSDDRRGFGIAYAPAGTQEKKKTGRSSPQNVSNEERMHQLIALQNFDGSWDLSATLLLLVGVKKTEVSAAFKTDSGNALSSGEKDSVQATILAVVWLETKMKGESEVWEMVVEKARIWVEVKIGQSRFDEESAGVKSLLEKP